MNFKGLLKAINNKTTQVTHCASLGLFALLGPLFFSCFIFSFAANALAQTSSGTPAINSAVNNQASANYNDSGSGRAASLNSNTVSAIVGRQIAFSLTASQNKSSAPGSNVRFQHSITNLGNANESFVISLQNNYPGTFNFTNVQLFLDANSDGVPDSNTPISGPVQLQAGETLQFIALAQVPTSASTGQEDRFVVIASPVSGALPAQTNTDTVTISNQAVIVVNKAFSVTQGPSPYNDLIVRLSYSNIGNSDARNVVITDVIGAINAAANFDTSGLEYVANSGSWQGQALSDTVGSDPVGINYVVSTNAGVSTVSATIDRIAPNASGIITFRVNVKSGLTTGASKTTNIASLSYFDGVGPQSAASNNNAFYRVLPSGPDVSITKTHSGAFVLNNDASFVIVVSNIGGGPTSGQLVVEDTMPAGLAVDAAALPNAVTNGTAGGLSAWSCLLNTAQVIRCTSSASIGAGQQHPYPIIIKVKPTQLTNGTALVNRAVVSGGGEDAAQSANNVATDSVQVVAGASISGSAWFDTNHNGKREANEPPGAGILVELVNANGVVIARTSTASDGSYTLKDLLPGDGYRILFHLPDGSTTIASAPVNGEQGQASGSSTASVYKGILQGISLAAGQAITQQSLRLDPSGVIYDSVTRKPVAGAIVQINGPPGFDPSIHLVGGSNNVIQITAASGIYQYIFLDGSPVGDYYLTVTSPAGYLSGISQTIRPAPSRNCPIEACLNPDGLAAYGTAFSVQPANIYTAPPLGQDTTYYTHFFLNIATSPDVVNNHIPLDPIGAIQTGLFIEKISNRATAEIGDAVVYTVRVSNRSARTITDLALTDTLPFGFKYIAETAKIGANKAATSITVTNRTLVLKDLPELAPDATLSITYLAQLVPGAQDGDGINRVQASAAAMVSNVAIAKVKVNSGIFTTRAIVLGKVFVDCNNNHIQDLEELGIPGVRLYLQDGTYVVTDSEGKFSIAGLAARTHVLKIDELTLPIGARMASSTNRHSGIGESRFVDLKSGELHRADFSEMSCSSAVLEQVKTRRKKAEVFSIEAERLLANKLDSSGKITAPSDPRAQPASGVIGVAQRANDVPTAAPAASFVVPITAITPMDQASQLKATRLPALTVAPTSARTETAQGSSTQILDEADNTLAFIDLKNGDTLPITQVNVRVKGTLGSSINLQVNGVTVNAQRIGSKSENPAKQTQFLEYIGVAMRPGNNVLTVSQIDSFGNARGTESITVVAPDQAGKILLDMPTPGPIADGVTLTKMTVRITDQAGIPVTARTPVTLEISHGRFKVEDVDKNEPGIQTFIVGGVAEFEIEPPLEPVEAKIKITSGSLQIDKRLYFLPQLRPMIANGIIEGIIHAKRFSANALQATRSTDGFEQSLRQFSKESATGERKAAAAASLFLKGKVKGEYLLTLAYDSEKDTRERLFRDIQPDEYYPVYGDSSIKGFDAQSTSHLYVRIDHEKSWLLWGDLTTSTSNPQQRLAQYQRSLTGLKHHYESNGVVVDSFASRDTVRQTVRELATNGTSGPYEFSLGDALINSERVELLVRDRNQPAVIIKTTTLTRNVDYGFEPLTGRLLLRSPAPSVDANLNPISLRISAEINQGGTPFWVAGVSASVAIDGSVTVGGSVVINKNPIPENFARLSSINGQWQVAEKSLLSAELAQTKRSDGLEGKAARIEWLHEGEKFKAKISAAKADITFDNPGAVVNKGRLEVGAKTEYALSTDTRIVAEGIISEDTNSGAKRTGILLAVEQSLSDTSKLEIGARVSKDHAATNLNNAVITPDTKVTSVRTKLSTQVPGLTSATAYVEAEQDLKNANKRLIAIGGDYQFVGRGKIYARHEFESALPGGFAIGSNAGATSRATSLVGISTDYMDNGTLFTEYRGRDSFGLKTTEAAIGLKNLFTLSDGLRLNTNIERVKALSGQRDQESSAVALGLDYTNSEHWRGSTRLEWRDGASTQSWLHTADGAFKINRDWTALARHIWNSTDTKAQGASSPSTKIQQRLQIGGAWRQTDVNTWNALLLAELKRESDTAATAEVSTRYAAIVSSHVNWQAANTLIVNGQYGTKWVRENILGDAHQSRSDRIAGRVTWDFAKNWDASAMASVIRDRRSGIAQSGLGLELGYQLKTNLWMSLGYNFTGYKDHDFTDGTASQKGIFLRLRFKLDEHSFSKLPY